MGGVLASRKEQEVAFGKTLLQVFARYDPRSFLWRTSPGSGTADSIVYSGTWPKCGITRSGRAYAPATSAHRTVESASSSSATSEKPISYSLLPTPVASDGHGGQDPAKRR